MQRKMQRIRLLQVGAVLLLSVALLLGLVRQSIILRLEQNKVSILLEAVRQSPVSAVDQTLRKLGRHLSDVEAEALSFPPTSGTSKCDYYWLHGGLMARICHENGSVLAIDLRKHEFR